MKAKRRKEGIAIWRGLYRASKLTLVDETHAMKTIGVLPAVTRPPKQGRMPLVPGGSVQPA